MSDSKVNFEFYVLNYDFNEKKVEMFNIFRNIHVYEEAIRLTRKHLRNKKKFPFDDYIEELRITIAWQEWGRREYEISVGDAFEDDIDKFEKWDCYQQALPNMEVIAKMCIDRYKQAEKNSN